MANPKTGGDGYRNCQSREFLTCNRGKGMTALVLELRSHGM